MSDDLIAKYGDARIPRYTSYPTAAAFSAAVGPDEYAGNLAHIAAAGPVSVYLHVPFCRSICWYCGCHTTITRQDAPVADYLDVMKEEIELVSFAAGNDVPVKYVHFGGGTPSVMAFYAASSWSGIVVENTYVASQEFNTRAAAMKAMAASGVEGALVVKGIQIRYDIHDKAGTPAIIDDVTLNFKRPVGDHAERNFARARAA